MPPTSDQLTVARSWIGETEDDETFSERFDRLGKLDDAIIESMRAQLAVLAFDTPSSLSTPDGLSIQFTENIRALQAQIKSFIAIGGTDGLPEENLGTNVTQAVRTQSR
jgi:hypothetical protein